MAVVKILKVFQQVYNAEKAIDLSKALKKSFSKDVAESSLSSNFVSIGLNDSINSSLCVRRRRSDEDILPLSCSFSVRILIFFIKLI